MFISSSKPSLHVLTVAILAALFSSGCAVGPDYQRPSVPLPDQYTRSATATAPADANVPKVNPSAKLSQQWWTAYGSPDINSLVQRAFEHSPTIDAARAALRQAHENAAAQYDSSFFPVFQLNYSASRQQNAVGTISPTLTSGDPMYTLHTAQVNVTYTPDVFGLNRRTVESLVAQEESQRYQLQAVYTTLASNVVNAAIQLASLDEQVKATQDAINANQRSVDILHQQAKAGYASGLDVAAQESALAQIQQTLPPLQKQRELAADQLAVLVGTVPNDADLHVAKLEDLKMPAEVPMSLSSDLIKQRPDVRASEAQVHAASASVGIAIANRLPQFSITGNYGGTSTHFSKMFKSGNRFWGLTGNASETILDFGALKHKQTAAEAALDQATAQYRGVVLGAFQNVADSLYALDADGRGVTASLAAETASKRTLDLTQRQQSAGAVNMLALLSAQQAYLQAKAGRIQAQAARLADTVALYQALGGGWTGDASEAPQASNN